MKMLVFAIAVIILNVAFVVIFAKEHKTTIDQLQWCKSELSTIMEPQTEITAYIKTINPETMELNAKQLIIDLSKNTIHTFSAEYMIKEITLIRK